MTIVDCQVPPERWPLTQDGNVARSRQSTDSQQAAESLRKLAELTSELAQDSPADAMLRDRLELAADILDATSRAEEGSVE